MEKNNPVLLIMLSVILVLLVAIVAIIMDIRYEWNEEKNVQKLLAEEEPVEDNILYGKITSMTYKRNPNGTYFVILYGAKRKINGVVQDVKIQANELNLTGVVADDIGSMEFEKGLDIDLSKIEYTIGDD